MNELIKKMKETYQVKDKQTVLEHGESVWEYFNDLFGERKLDWKLPTWFEENLNFIKENLLPREVIKEYVIMHDCGKPYCLIKDEKG